MPKIHDQNFLCRIGLHSGSYISEAPTSCRQLYVCSRCNRDMMPSSGYQEGLSGFLPLFYGLAPRLLSIGIVVATAFVAFSYLPFFIACFIILASIIISVFVFYGLDPLIDSAQGNFARTKHESYSPYEYVSEQDCNQIATCTRCGDRQNRIVHTYGELEYENSDACRKVATCKWCGDITSSVLHTFDKGNYITPGACDFLKLCTRCGVHHEIKWHEWKGGVCKRCGEVEEERGEGGPSRPIFGPGGISGF